MPIISVIIAAYNAESTIAQTIESLLSQTFSDIELLVGDDGSKDGTVEVVRRFSDPRIRLIMNERNLGAGPTRDLLIRAAEGDFLAFVDADDVVVPRRFERLLEVMPEHESCLLFDDVVQCHHTAQGMVPWRPIHGLKAFGRKKKYADLIGPLRIADLLGAKCLLLKPLIKRAAVISMAVRHPSIRYGEDGVFFWTLVARGLPAFYLPEAYYLYRISPGSASSAFTRHSELAVCIDVLLEEELSSSDRHAAVRRRALALAQGRVKRLARERGLSKLHAVWVLVSDWHYLSYYISCVPRSIAYACSRFLYGGKKR